MIFEYHLPTNANFTRTQWAQKWHALGGATLPLGSSAYNAALQAVTDRFTARGAGPGLPNGNAISQIRTNDFLDFSDNNWELREFHLVNNASKQGFLIPATTAQAPDQKQFNGTTALATFLNANKTAINNGTVQIPASMLGGESFETTSQSFVWSAPGVDATTLKNFSLLTCNGCHKENGVNASTAFYQVDPVASPGVDGKGRLSTFILGNVATGEPSDLARRATELQEVLCKQTCADGGTTSVTAPARVH
jgi:hypothetical protein